MKGEKSVSDEKKNVDFINVRHTIINPIQKYEWELFHKLSQYISRSLVKRKETGYFWDL